MMSVLYILMVGLIAFVGAMAGQWFAFGLCEGKPLLTVFSGLVMASMVLTAIII